MKTTKFCLLALTFLVVVLFNVSASNGQQNEEDDYISPVRPTVSDSGKVQKKGVLQVEYGIDADFRAPDCDNRQSTPLGIYFAASNRLRLDLEIETVASQSFLGRETGIGDVTPGFKTLLRTDPDKRQVSDITKILISKEPFSS